MKSKWGQTCAGKFCAMVSVEEEGLSLPLSHPAGRLELMAATGVAPTRSPRRLFLPDPGSNVAPPVSWI